MFPNCPNFAEALVPVANEKGVNITWTHNLVEINSENRIAIFKNMKSDELVPMDFDFLHFVPPQTAPKFVRDSPLSVAAPMGWPDVNAATLQHNKYANVFGCGDVAGVPTAKTAAAVFA